MVREVKLNELEGISYPATRGRRSRRTDDISRQYADGEERLGDVLERSTEDVYVSRDDLESEIYSDLPTEAVGEPGQSEGDG